MGRRINRRNSLFHQRSTLNRNFVHYFLNWQYTRRWNLFPTDFHFSVQEAGSRSIFQKLYVFRVFEHWRRWNLMWEGECELLANYIRGAKFYSMRWRNWNNGFLMDLLRVKCRNVPRREISPCWKSISSILFEQKIHFTICLLSLIDISPPSSWRCSPIFLCLRCDTEPIQWGWHSDDDE